MKGSEFDLKINESLQDNKITATEKWKGGTRLDHSVILVDGNKYMWDGKTYDNESAAKERMAQYQKDKFLTMLKKEGNEYRNYTRRVVKKTVLEGGDSP